MESYTREDIQYGIDGFLYVTQPTTPRETRDKICQKLLLYIDTAHQDRLREEKE